MDTRTGKETHFRYSAHTAEMEVRERERERGGERERV